MPTKNSFPNAVLAISAIFLGLSGCAGPASQRMSSDSWIETGRITGKKLLASVDQPSPAPVTAGMGGGAISGGGGGFGGIGLGLDLTSQFSHPPKTQNIYEYELTTADRQVLKINSNVELKEGDCAKAIVTAPQGMSKIEASSAC
ncbi:hypothetical protein R75461_08366 [Paraburkholderia nemoris]|uniref:hypothetical protein n=1 Tax=Paraburkholderia nemoris TaxID=2793076 RepID=UPI00190A32A2|nr:MULTISPECIES: hypothetical protein [Paraburkholderia]MBK3787139.1 hypothetical protein [Paraburkholderia aspalathi]CAE6867409.1 hypothetical protein R75461_08366 [Paraburkholderia nemoris]